MNSFRPAAIALDFDLVVTGGGLAGLCASIAAAREGARTALIQDRPVPGGNCSSEVRVVPHGTNHSNAWAQETGLPYAILLEDRHGNHEQFIDHGMINTHFDLTLMEFARREPNLTVYYNTSVRAVESEAIGEERAPEPSPNGLGRIGGGPRRITVLHASQGGSEKEFIFRAPQFIDATGDGTIGALAGADFLYGREARAEHQEPLAPVKTDDVTMGSTISLRARDMGRPVPFTPPPWIEEYRTLEEIGFTRTLYHLEKPVYGGFWWMEVCNPFHQIDDNAEIRNELHRHVIGVWNYIKNHSPDRDRAANYALEWVGMIPGKRESRRLLGDVLLTEHDCHEDRQWPDAIAYAGWWIDLHIKGGILNKIDPGERENADANYKHWIRIPVFTLPLRSFYSRNVENLWMTGRCLSVTHVALGPSRVMQSLGMMGHAVGLAAAHAVREKISPRETATPGGAHLATIRQKMLRGDVRIPGLRNTDPHDLALTAQATASSEAGLDLSEPKPNDWRYLGKDKTGRSRYGAPALAMVVPLTAARLEGVALYVKNFGAETAHVTCGLQKLKTIWDRPDEKCVRVVPVEVPGDFEGWVDIPLHAATEANRPYRISLHVGADEGRLGWALAQQRPVGAVASYLHICLGGPEAKNAHLPGFQPEEVTIPAYRHWRHMPHDAMALRLTPPSTPYGAHCVNDGCAWPEDLPHLWVSSPSQPLPQHVDLAWEKSVKFSRVEVSFDTNLSRLVQMEVGFFHSPECARDWRLLVLEGVTWREIYREEGNYQRKRIATFARVETTALRLEILATNGAPEARVYEIRVY